MSDEKNPKGGTPGASDWSKHFRRILRDSEAMRKQHEATLAIVDQMTKSEVNGLPSRACNPSKLTPFHRDRC